ncbi:MAG: peptigoglycan-binding protein LysM [Rhodobacteraceae bacterium PARR1]|nr:MAG: peptigoglycan-binding protein LysM [Rhodobacteraceae bacterium PARR1]
MKPWAELTTGARGARIGGVVAVVAAILWGMSSLRGGPHRGGPDGDNAPAMTKADDAAAAAAPEPEPAPAADATAAPAADATAAAPAEPAAEPAPAEETAAAPAVAPALPAAPTLDVVRIEQDGSAVIAGKGAPGSSLSLRVDGAEVIAIPADASGNFVGMFSLPPSDAARALSVVMVLADGTEIPAGSTVAIAPTVAPVIAQTEPAEPAETAAADTAAAEPAAAPAAAPAALMVTDAGAKVLQGIGDGTVAAANVTVDAISYTPEGAVVLAGRGTAGALVRLYLDNAATAEATVAQAGDWSVTLADIKPGIYTLRVDQVDAGGNVTSRFETPFKRESLEALAAAAAPAEPVAAPAATEPAAATTTAAETVTPEPAAPTATEAAATEAAPEVAETAAEPTATTEVAGAEPAVPAETASTDPAEAPVTEVVAEAPAAEPAPTAQAPAPIQITVQPGYTLWRIARENLGDGVMYVQVFEANKDQIRDPDLIYPGQIFTIAPKP